MDDVALIHKNKDELQKMLNITEEISKRYHLKFGQEKSQTITIGKQPDTPFKLGQMNLDNTTTYKYLGTTINNKGTMDDHIKKTKGKTEAALQTIFNIAGNKDFNQLEMKTIWKLVDCCCCLTSLCHSNGHIETMPAREINPFTALTRIRTQVSQDTMIDEQSQRVDTTTH